MELSIPFHTLLKFVDAGDITTEKIHILDLPQYIYENAEKCATFSSNWVYSHPAPHIMYLFDVNQAEFSAEE